MYSLSRPPLLAAKRDNIPAKSYEQSKAVEDKLNKALAGQAEERRKRAEAEGVMEGLKREKELLRTSKIAVEKELALAQAEIKAQKTTIMRRSTAAATSSDVSASNAEFEARLQDLVEKHNRSKEKSQAEIHDLKTSNLSLQSLIDAQQTSCTTDRQTITDLRSERALLKKELDTLRSRPVLPIRDEKASEMSRFKDERKLWREEKMGLEAEVRDLNRKAAEGNRLAVAVEGLEERVESLQELLNESAMACARLERSTVDRRAYLAVRDELALTRSARGMYERKWRESRGLCRILKEENAELRGRIEEVGEERDRAEGDLADLLRQRKADRAQAHGIHRAHPDPPALLDTSTDLITLIDLTLNHITLLTSHTSSIAESHLASISSLSHDLTHALSSLSTARTSLSTLQTTHSTTSAELESMLSAHSDCGKQIMDWRAEANRATAAEARLKSELCDVRRELERVEEQMKGEREMLRRANEGSARWGSARVALEDEVRSLRLALEDARGLQQRYEAIEEEVEILRSREAMASEEAERLGIQNAELIGHGNGGQKISYVEGLRREMALVKHELATTRHHLNTASSQITDLTAEIEAYKSIAPALLSSTSGTGRVRVARRQPEGGEVLGASLARRSVSTSTGGLGRY